MSTYQKTHLNLEPKHAVLTVTELTQLSISFATMREVNFPKCVNS